MTRVPLAGVSDSALDVALVQDAVDDAAMT